MDLSGRLVLRRARLVDAERLCELHHSAIRALAGEHYSPRELDAWTYHTPAHFRWALLQPQEWFLVAKREGQIVGFSSLKGDLLQATYVDPAEANAGVGRRLIEAVEHEARRRGVTRLRLRASLNGVGFYQRLGFRSGRRGTIPTLSGVPLSYVSMRKELLARVEEVPPEATRAVLHDRAEANRRHRLFVMTRGGGARVSEAR